MKMINPHQSQLSWCSNFRSDSAYRFLCGIISYRGQRAAGPLDVNLEVDKYLADSSLVRHFDVSRQLSICTSTVHCAEHWTSIWCCYRTTVFIRWKGVFATAFKTDQCSFRNANFSASGNVVTSVVRDCWVWKWLQNYLNKMISLCWQTVWLILKSERSKYWYCYSNTKKVLVLAMQSIIDIGIGNTFCKAYWYWYCQYFLKVLLTTLITRLYGYAMTFVIFTVFAYCICAFRYVLMLDVLILHDRILWVWFELIPLLCKSPSNTTWN